MSFFKTLQEKPWETPETAIGDGVISPIGYDPAKIALRFIMGVVSVLFFLFVINVVRSNALIAHLSLSFFFIIG